MIAEPAPAPLRLVPVSPPERPRVLILHPHLRPVGGGEAVGAWMLDALQESCRLALVTWTHPDFTAVNRWYGTSIRASEIAVHVVPRATRMIAAAVPFRLALMRSAIVIRAGRRLEPDFDVVISAENEAAMAQPIIQYVHYPRLLRPRPSSDLRWYHRVPGVLQAYYAACDVFLPRSADAIAQNLTLVNSAWTGERVRVAHPSAGSTVLYPPVTAGAADAGWDRRENGFVCIGRFADEKAADTIIDILAAVRRVVPDVHLHFAGVRAGRPAFRRLQRLVRPHRAWIDIHENLSRDELAALVARHRYGIHGMRDEHFGIAPAEMVRAGCIVFLPDGGGQVEIVRGDPRVLYRSREDAVDRILRVIGSPAEQVSLRAHLETCGGTFAAERFARSIREIVARFHADRRAGAAR